MLAAIYARYSSENQRPESIEDQVAACRRLAGQRGFTIVEEHIYSDQALSGDRKDRTTTCKSRDILSSRWRVFILYWLPAIAIVVAGAPVISSGWRTIVWTVALATMGVACIVNALRCGRVHYYLTGPFFLLMALIALSYGLGILHLSGNGWNLLAPTDPDPSHRPVVSARDVFGKISATKLTQTGSSSRIRQRPIF